MNIRSDIVRMYIDVHSWVGIVAGLALFIAFYAGAITMFEEPLQSWASPPTRLAAPPPLERTQELIDKALAAHPEAAKSYTIHLRTGPERPARMSWPMAQEGQRERGLVQSAYATLTPDGTLQVETQQPSAVADLIDVLHQQVGLPFEHEVSMPIVGAISLLYAIAIASGLIVLLPSLVKDLFALRISKNFKRMWLDVHNVLGVFSLPFHIIMALTAVVFAFHDEFYGAQQLAFVVQDPPQREASAPPQTPPLSPAEIVQRVGEQAPNFTLTDLSFGARRGGVLTLRASGTDPRHGLRGPTFGIANVDPYTGKIVSSDYTPGLQDGWGATITSFFALHFGTFGGTPVRWAYFLLGLAGAFLFYTGNLLWIESRRKKERKGVLIPQSRSTQVLGNLTVGWTLGCIGGISLTIAAAKWLPAFVDNPAPWHTGIYYAAFLAGIAWAFLRGAAVASVELLYAAAALTACIPFSSFVGAIAPLGPTPWSHGGSSIVIDATAVVGAIALWTAGAATQRRIRLGQRDTIWTQEKLAMTPAENVG